MSQYRRDSENITCPVCSLYSRASCFGNAEYHDFVQPVQDCLRSVEVCYISNHRFLIKLLYTFQILQCLDSRKEYLPQFRNTCFVVLVFLLS
jgi:hypothetical protein